MLLGFLIPRSECVAWSGFDSLFGFGVLMLMFYLLLP